MVSNAFLLLICSLELFLCFLLLSVSSSPHLSALPFPFSSPQPLHFSYFKIPFLALIFFLSSFPVRFFSPSCESPFCSTVATQSGSAVWAEALGKRSVRRREKGGGGITARLPIRSRVFPLFLPASLGIDRQFDLFLFRDKKHYLSHNLYCILTFLFPSSDAEKPIWSIWKCRSLLSNRDSNWIVFMECMQLVANLQEITHKSRFKLYYSSLLCFYDTVTAKQECHTLCIIKAISFFPLQLHVPGLWEAQYCWVPKGVLNVIVIGIEFQINQAHIFLWH